MFSILACQGDTRKTCREFALTRMAIMIKTVQIVTSIDEDVEKSEPSHLLLLLGSKWFDCPGEQYGGSFIG